MRCGAVLLLAALLLALQAEGALFDDEYERALRDEGRRTECEDCPRCPDPPARCAFLVYSGENYFYNVDGVKLKIELTPWRLKMKCPPGVTLESASLPVFPIIRRAVSVELNSCPAPRLSGGISRVLAYLNIAAELDALYLDDLPPDPLQNDLFVGLQHLHWLFMSAQYGTVLEMPPGLLDPLVKLQSIYLTDVRMSAAALARLPPIVMFINLIQRSPAEGWVVVAPAPLSTDIENDTLTVARGSCSELQGLTVTSPRGTAALPVGWLQVRGEARCPQLRDLSLNSCALTAQPADALRGLTKLRVLHLKDCRELRALPRDLFVDTRALHQLFLENNALEVLPDGIFTPLRELEFLDLSGNMLGALGDGAAALGGVRSLTSLRVLTLDHNPLGDTCGHSSRDATLTASELSPLRDLRALRQLSLAYTGASRLCEDWLRDLNALYKIDFSYNNLTVLKNSDMQWYGRDREVDRLELRLAGSNLTSLPDALPASLRVLDLRSASLPAATERQVDVLFADGRDVMLRDASVSCACAGGARPTLARLLVARVPDVRCAEDGQRLRDVPPCPVVVEPGLRGAWAGALGALAVATLVVGGAWYAARRGSRLRVKVFLLARGLCTAWTRHDDEDCPYDVFIWFSRHDFTVVSQIVRELEKGPRPLRVCVHYRDWRAGESILTQIQQSVVQSRRTLVLECDF